MPGSEVILGAVLVLALTLYFLFGGADFGGGVWDLLSTGPRRTAQRAAIDSALGPVWEPNHVWLIFAIVVMFTGFPPVFAALATALYVPLTLFLVGIVLRGSAFSFRALHHGGHGSHVADGGHDDRQTDSRPSAGERAQLHWGRIFSIASLVAPFLLGTMVATIASGRVGAASAAGLPAAASWLSPFSVACGILAVALTAFLAATYLTVEVTDPALRDDFRRRALGSGLAAGGAAGAAFFMAEQAAPLIYAGLTDRPFTWPLHVATGTSAVGALTALWLRRFRLARALAATQVALVICGWAVSQYPYLLPPSFTLATGAAPERTRQLLLIVLAAGVPVLAPSLVVLYRVFKRDPAIRTALP